MSPDTEHNSENESKTEADDKTEQSSPSNKDTGTKRRTKTGCLTCRRRRIKCGEERPVCKNCIKSKRECAGYNQTLIYKQHGQPYSQPVSVTAPNTGYAWSHIPTQSANHSFGSSTPLQSLAYTTPDREPGLQAQGTEWQMNVSSAEPYLPVSQTAHASSNPGNNALPPWQQQDYSLAAIDGSGASRISQSSHIGLAPIPGSEVSTTEPNISNHFTYNTPEIGAKRYSNFGFVQRPSYAKYLQPHTTDVSTYKNGTTFTGAADDSDDPWDVDMDDDNNNNNNSSGNNVEDRDNLTHGPQTVSALSIAGYPNQAGATSSINRNPVTSPLLEEKSRNIFNHFISVTGPCMGTFDRHDTIAGSSIPRMIWTHGLPAMAFSCSALAHGMLALSAMHMFALNLGNENTAVKHFTHALRHVGQLLADPMQRHQVATLATVLLLGYYEVMAGDHSRWNLHLSGAGKLVMEHNYAGMIRTVRRMRAKKKSSIAQTPTLEHSISQQDYLRLAEAPPSLLGDDDWKVDQDLISKLMGCDVNYDTQVQSNFQAALATTDFTSENLNDWRNLMELYWFYCRQDVFMSMLSGDPLLLPFSQWKYCPPRGSFSNPDRPNTTLDHLWLVIARLTDFGGKDRKRKQRVVSMQGGHWIPPPGFLHLIGTNPGVFPPRASANPHSQSMTAPQPSTRPNANEGRARVARQVSDQAPLQPSFYGMLPPNKEPVQMSDSFKIMNDELKGGASISPIDADSPQGQDLDAQTRHALEEHAAIVAAFDLFESLLGPDFQPLPPSDIQITTPFGPALRYKTPAIAVMWTFFLTGRILLRRLHPYSPPAAMISAGVNARFTQEYAQTIGRICGGLYAQHSYLLQAGYVDHVLSAAVIETTFTLLFAAVQYQDPVQRGWTIGKLSEIAKVTGWQTAAAVAAACEAAWEQAGLAGKGPVYERTMDQNNEDARLNGKWKLKSTQDAATGGAGSTPIEEYTSRFVSHDRNLIDKHASTRAHWALGLLSLEEDLQRIALKDEE